LGGKHKLESEKEPLEFHRQQFDSIQALRGITSLFIVLEHIRFLNCGAFGVDIFFCISGFMIMFSTHTNTKYFLRKRLIRILPLYYLMTIGTYLLLILFPGMFEQTRANPVFLLKSLLFIPFDIGGGILQPLMRIGWTINCEVFFYLLFWIALQISHKYRGLLCSVFLLGITSAASLLPINSLTPMDSTALTFYGNPVMLEFILGILSYYAARSLYQLKQSSKLPSLFFPLSILVLLSCFGGLVLTKPTIDITGFRRPFVWGLPALVIVLCTFVLGLFLKKPLTLLVRLGDASFSLYLIHYYPVMLLDRAVFDFSAASPYSLLGAAAAIGISIVLALISRIILEKRFSGWLYRRLLPGKGS